MVAGVYLSLRVAIATKQSWLVVELRLPRYARSDTESRDRPSELALSGTKGLSTSDRAKALSLHLRFGR